MIWNSLQRIIRYPRAAMKLIRIISMCYLNDLITSIDPINKAIPPAIWKHILSFSIRWSPSIVSNNPSVARVLFFMVFVLYNFYDTRGKCCNWEPESRELWFLRLLSYRVVLQLLWNRWWNQFRLRWLELWWLLLLRFFSWPVFEEKRTEDYNHEYAD